MNRLAYMFCAALIAAASLTACGTAAVPTTVAQPSVVHPLNPNGSPTAAPVVDGQPTSGPNIKHPLNPGGAAPLIKITTNGGMCPNGGCSTSIEIAPDGTFHAADSTGANHSGTLDPALAAALVDLVAKADFAEMRSHPFTGTCPIAYDGQEYVYTFHTAGGDETIASCQVAVDATAPLFQALDGALTTIRQ